MSRFYTHVLNGTGFVTDEEGQDFPGLEEARHNDLVTAGQLVAEEMTAGRYKVDLELYIHDAKGSLLATLPVSARVSSFD